MQFHILSFEGPDAYSRIGGLATRVNGLADTLANQGNDVHLWFVGDPDLDAHEQTDRLSLHRWCQPISRRYPGRSLYVGEEEKVVDFAAFLPPYLLQHPLIPYLLHEGRQAVVLAEEWQTVPAVLHLDKLLRQANLRDCVTILWTANNTFGFENIDWKALAAAARIATVSRWMRCQMQRIGVDATVIPNGLALDNYLPPDRTAVAQLRSRFRRRTVLTKVARWDPDKRWLASLDIIALLKRNHMNPLFIARGGMEPYGQEVFAHAHRLGLRIDERNNFGGTLEGALRALCDCDELDIISLKSPIDADTRRVLFNASDVVLANSEREPFGLVGLEAMAVGGIACTGCSGEDYAISGRNALMLQSGDPNEFMWLYKHLHENPKARIAMRRAGRTTARHYAWPEVVRRNFIPQLGLAHHRQATCAEGG